MSSKQETIQDPTGARAIATGPAYRSDVDGNDSADLSAAITEGTPAPPDQVPTLGRARCFVAARFATSADQADLHVILYARKDDGTRTFISSTRFPGVSPDANAMRETAPGSFLADLIEHPCAGADFIEVRANNLVGTITRLDVWTA